MKILHLNAFEHGGAARAAQRLHLGLRRLGHDSILLLKQGATKEQGTLFFDPKAHLLTRGARRLRQKRIQNDFAPYVRSRTEGQELFSDDRSVLRSSLRNQLPSCDVINLHWVAGFVDYSDFLSQVPRKTPTVWTLHDMNPFTGGCHYDEECGKFATACGACPQLGSKDEEDLSHQIWQRKRKALAMVPPHRLHIVADSNWLASEAKRSSAFAGLSVTAIHYGLDVESFAPRARLAARSVLGIPENAQVILFGADNLAIQRKGFAFLTQALAGLSDDTDPFLLSMGEGVPSFPGRFPQLHLGFVSGDRFLSIVYSAADVFVIPSLQEAFGQTALESMACGTPVVGFSVGGIREVVRDGLTGLLVPLGDSCALQQAIRKVLSSASLHAELASNCRKTAVEEYSLEIQARRYVELYQQLLSEQENSS